MADQVKKHVYMRDGAVVSTSRSGKFANGTRFTNTHYEPSTNTHNKVRYVRAKNGRYRLSGSVVRKASRDSAGNTTVIEYSSGNVKKRRFGVTRSGLMFALNTSVGVFISLCLVFVLFAGAKFNYREASSHWFNPSRFIDCFNSGNISVGTAVVDSFLYGVAENNNVSSFRKLANFLLSGRQMLRTLGNFANAVVTDQFTSRSDEYVQAIPPEYEDGVRVW